MRRIVVNCEYNKFGDICCGGPRFLGYDFFVDENEYDIEDMKSFIKDELHKNHFPLLDISDIAELQEGVKGWNKDMILECIKKGY